MKKKERRIGNACRNPQTKAAGPRIRARFPLGKISQSSLASVSPPEYLTIVLAGFARKKKKRERKTREHKIDRQFTVESCSEKSDTFVSFCKLDERKIYLVLKKNKALKRAFVVLLA